MLRKSWLFDSELEELLREDLPQADATSIRLFREEDEGEALLISREGGRVCCTEEAAELYSIVGCSAEAMVSSGREVEPGEVLLRAVGNAYSLHSAWRVAQVLVSYMSGISTYTAKLVEEARKGNPTVIVAATRQSFPGMRKLSIKAVYAGGGEIHRQSLSDAILIFSNHLLLSGKDIEEAVKELKSRVGYKTIGIEISNLEEALRALSAGAMYVQFDRADPMRLKEWVREIRKSYPSASIGVGGGITIENAREYASSGVDVIVTSSMFRAPPLDLTTKMRKTN
ncbi:MAG: ModD protein [Fervidicoccaceae archaeon]